MSIQTYRVGLRGTMFYLMPLVFMAVVGLGFYYFDIRKTNMPDFIFKFLLIPWLACLGIFGALALFRGLKSYQLRISGDHLELTEHFLMFRLKTVVVSPDTGAEFRVEIPMPSPGAGPFSPSILFYTPKRMKIGKGLSIADLQDITDKLKSVSSAPISTTSV